MANIINMQIMRITDIAYMIKKCNIHQYRTSNVGEKSQKM